jgi:transposase InsO family protein
LLKTSESAKAGAIEGRKLQLKEETSDQAVHNRKLNGLKQSISLSEKSQRRMDAKIEVLHAADAYRMNRSLSVRRADPEFAKAYNARQIEMPDWVRDLVPHVSKGSIRNWRRIVKKESIDQLAGRYLGRKGTSKIDMQPAVRDLVIGLLVTKPHVRATHVIQALRARLGNGDVVLPSKRSLERWMKQWKADNAQTFCALSNPDKWKNRYMVAYGSASEGVTRLNQRWELDSTPADVMLTDGRHSIIGVLDVYSRRGKLLVTKTSKATAIAALMRRALLDWGVPEVAKTDNGSDYKGHHIKRVFSSLDIEHSLCPPFQPWHKPHIERFFRTFSHDLVELLDGFIGHNVAERQAIRDRQSFADRLLQRNAVFEINRSSADFQEFCDRWCEDIYLHRGHEGEGLGGKSPLEVIAAWREPVRQIQDERALDILLAEAPDNHGLRKARKKGVEIDGAWFFAPELEAFTDQYVQVLYDPHDLGRVYVRGGPDLQFVCIAECPKRTGIDRQEVAARAKEMQKKRIQEERRNLKAIARSIKTDDIVNEILRDGARRSSKLHLFPQPTEAHESAGLTAAVNAAAAHRARLEPPRPREQTDEERAIHEQWIAEQLQPRAINLKDDNSDCYALACTIERRLQEGLPVTEQDREWLAHYQTTSFYSLQKEFYKSFNLAAGTDAVRVWETAFDRAYDLTQESMSRELTTDEQEFLMTFRKEHLDSARGIDALIEAARSGMERITASAG